MGMARWIPVVGRRWPEVQGHGCTRAVPRQYPGSPKAVPRVPKAVPRLLLAQTGSYWPRQAPTGPDRLYWPRQAPTGPDRLLLALAGPDRLLCWPDRP